VRLKKLQKEPARNKGSRTGPLDRTRAGEYPARRPGGRNFTTGKGRQGRSQDEKPAVKKKNGRRKRFEEELAPEEEGEKNLQARSWVMVQKHRAAPRGDQREREKTGAGPGGGPGGANI